MARRGRAVARNLVQPVTARFVGDPAGSALTRATFDPPAAALQARSGQHIYAGDVGSMERAFHGYAASPQPVLAGRVMTARQGTPVVFVNGPNDYSSMPSTEAGTTFLDARYRALATKLASR